MEKFRKLKVWQKAHRLILATYKITMKFPNEEKFGLVSQMRQATISVTANIVEGTKKKSKKERKYFHEVADTSLEELKYYFILSYNLNYLTKNEGRNLTELAREIGKMLNCLNKTI